jgi:Domain of unknown function (DUF4124)
MKTSSLVSIVILLAAASAPVHAQVYKWVDEAGQTHYSDKAPAGKKSRAVVDRISVYASDPSPVRAMASAGAVPGLSDRVDSLERQLYAERQARQQLELAAYDAQASQAAYERCFADRRVDCDGYDGYGPYAVPIAVVPVRHRRPIRVRAGNVVGPGIMPGTFNGPNAITAGNFTFRNNARAF